MAQEPQPLSELSPAFKQKLGELRRTLPAEEQQMLDTLVLAAHGVPREDAVRGYQEAGAQAGGGSWWYRWFYGPNPAQPQWYQGVAPPGQPYPGPGAGYGSAPS